MNSQPSLHKAQCIDWLLKPQWLIISPPVSAYHNGHKNAALSSGYENNASSAASKHRLFKMQALLAFILAWPSNIQSDRRLAAAQRSDRGFCCNLREETKFANMTASWFLDYGLPTRSTVPSLLAVNLNSWHTNELFRGHETSASSAASKHQLFTMQVRKQFPLFTKQSNEPFLLLFLCPQVLHPIVYYCFLTAYCCCFQWTSKLTLPLKHAPICW